MSYSFPASGNNTIRKNSAVATAVPLTFSCWFKRLDTGDGKNHGTVAISATGAQTNNCFDLVVMANGDVRAMVMAAGVQNWATAGPIGDTGWHHILAEFAGNASRTAYLDGIAGSADTTSRTPSAATLNDTMAGCFITGTNIYDSQGHYVMGVGIWNATLSAGEKAALAAGDSPLKIKRGNLIWAPDLIANAWEPIAGASLSVSGPSLSTETMNLRMPRIRGGLIRPGGIRLAA